MQTVAIVEGYLGNTAGSDYCTPPFTTQQEKAKGQCRCLFLWPQNAHTLRPCTAMFRPFRLRLRMQGRSAIGQCCSMDDQEYYPFRLLLPLVVSPNGCKAVDARSRQQAWRETWPTSPHGPALLGVRVVFSKSCFNSCQTATVARGHLL